MIQNYVAWNWKMGDSYGTPSTISVGSSTQHDTSQYKFGTSSIKIANGGSGTGLTIPQSSHVSPNGTNSKTYETWIRITGTGDSAPLWKGTQSDWFSPLLFLQSNGTIGFGNQSNGGSNLAYIYSSALSVNTWHHVACTVKNKYVRIFINGVLSVEKYYTTGTWTPAGSELQVASKNGTNSTVWVDQIRISNFIRYESNFSVPTAAFSNDSSTALLIQSNTTNGSTTFVDTSGAAANTSGSITTNVSANVAYGQSIIKYTGNSTSGATVGHGLSAAPEFVFTKADENGYDWPVYHSGLASTSHTLTLNLTALSGVETNKYNGTAPSSTVVTLGNHGTNRPAGQLMYAFHSVAGYSKFGSYSGSGSSGKVVTTGFAPAFVLIKRTDAANIWSIYDNTRNPYNPVDKFITNSSVAENNTGGQNLNFTSTGFTVESNG